MSDVKLLAMGGGIFKPATAQDADLLSRFKTGDIMAAKVTRTRNAGFHRKFFALLNIGFDAFESHAEWKGEVVKKNFERFREDVTILAGYYDLVPRINGEVKAEAKSISFASMKPDDFEKLYNEVANVILTRVLTNYTKDDLDNVVDQIMGLV
jgi:hypothetical protein